MGGYRSDSRRSSSGDHIDDDQRGPTTQAEHKHQFGGWVAGGRAMGSHIDESGV